MKCHDYASNCNTPAAEVDTDFDIDFDLKVESGWKFQGDIYYQCQFLNPSFWLT